MEENFKNFKKFKMENYILIKYKFLRKVLEINLDFYSFCIDQLDAKNLERNLEICEKEEKLLEQVKEDIERWKKNLDIKEIKEINQVEIAFEPRDLIDSKISIFNLRKFELFKSIEDLNFNLAPKLKLEEIYYKAENMKKKKGKQEIKKENEGKNDVKQNSLFDLWNKNEDFKKKREAESLKKLMNQPLMNVKLINTVYILKILKKLKALKINCDWINLWIKSEAIILDEKNEIEKEISSLVEMKEKKYDIKYKDILFKMQEINFKEEEEEMLNKWIHLCSLSKNLENLSIKIDNREINKIKIDINKILKKRNINILKDINDNHWNAEMYLEIMNEEIYEKKNWFSSWKPYHVVEDNWAKGLKGQYIDLLNVSKQDIIFYRKLKENEIIKLWEKKYEKVNMNEIEGLVKVDISNIDEDINERKIRLGVMNDEEEKLKIKIKKAEENFNLKIKERKLKRLEFEKESKKIMERLNKTWIDMPNKFNFYSLEEKRGINFSILGSYEKKEKAEKDNLKNNLLDISKISEISEKLSNSISNAYNLLDANKNKRIWNKEIKKNENFMICGDKRKYKDLIKKIENLNEQLIFEKELNESYRSILNLNINKDNKKRLGRKRERKKAKQEKEKLKEEENIIIKRKKEEKITFKKRERKEILDDLNNKIIKNINKEEKEEKNNYYRKMLLDIYDNKEEINELNNYKLNLEEDKINIIKNKLMKLKNNEFKIEKNIISFRRDVILKEEKDLRGNVKIKEVENKDKIRNKILNYIIINKGFKNNWNRIDIRINKITMLEMNLLVVNWWKKKGDIWNFSKNLSEEIENNSNIEIFKNIENKIVIKNKENWNENLQIEFNYNILRKNKIIILNDVNQLLNWNWNDLKNKKFIWNFYNNEEKWYLNLDNIWENINCFKVNNEGNIEININKINNLDKSIICDKIQILYNENIDLKKICNNNEWIDDVCSIGCNIKDWWYEVKYLKKNGFKILREIKEICIKNCKFLKKISSFKKVKSKSDWYKKMLNKININKMDKIEKTKLENLVKKYLIIEKDLKKMINIKKYDNKELNNFNDIDNKDNYKNLIINEDFWNLKGYLIKIKWKEIWLKCVKFIEEMNKKKFCNRVIELYNNDKFEELSICEIFEEDNLYINNIVKIKEKILENINKLKENNDKLKKEEQEKLKKIIENIEIIDKGIKKNRNILWDYLEKFENEKKEKKLEEEEEEIGVNIEDKKLIEINEELKKIQEEKIEDWLLINSKDWNINEKSIIRVMIKWLKKIIKIVCFNFIDIKEIKKWIRKWLLLVIWYNCIDFKNLIIQKSSNKSLKVIWIKQKKANKTLNANKMIYFILKSIGIIDVDNNKKNIKIGDNKRIFFRKSEMINQFEQWRDYELIWKLLKLNYIEDNYEINRNEFYKEEEKMISDSKMVFKNKLFEIMNKNISLNIMENCYDNIELLFNKFINKYERNLLDYIYEGECNLLGKKINKMLSNLINNIKNLVESVEIDMNELMLYEDKINNKVDREDKIRKLKVRNIILGKGELLEEELDKEEKSMKFSRILKKKYSLEKMFIIKNEEIEKEKKNKEIQKEKENKRIIEEINKRLDEKEDITKIEQLKEDINKMKKFDRKEILEKYQEEIYEIEEGIDYIIIKGKKWIEENDAEEPLKTIYFVKRKDNMKEFWVQLDEDNIEVYKKLRRIEKEERKKKGNKQDKEKRI